MKFVTEKQLLAMIATLQQQVSTMLLQQQGSQVEIARPQVFNGKIEKVSTFINTVTPQANFLWKITFDTLYNNRFLIRVCSRTLSISSERTTI